MAAARVLALGDLLLDLTVRYDPASGEADAGPDAVQIWPGGSAANFAVQAARLGAPVAYIGRVGRDWAGEMMLRSLEIEGIEAHVRVTEEEPTGRVLVMLDPQGRRRMYSYPGASATLSPDDLDSAWFRGIEAFHLTGYSFLREGPRPAALEALRLAREHGSPFCSLDPNPGHLISDFGPERFRDLLAGLRFDLILPNLQEGRLLSGKEAPEDVARGLLDLAPLVALKLGSEGCVVATRSGVFRAPALPVEHAVDDTGAGDAYAAGFVVEYLRARDPHAAALAGNRAGAASVAAHGPR